MTAAEQLELARTHDRAQRLLLDLAQNECRPFMLAFLRHALDRVNAGGIDRRHVAHPKNEHLRNPGDLGDHFLELRRRAEEKRTVDFVDLHARGDFVSTDVFLPLPHLSDLPRILRRSLAQFSGHALDVGDVAHSFHEQKRGNDDPDLHGNGKVDEDRQREREEQNHEIAARRAEQAGERAPLAHVIRHHDENCRERAERNHRRPLAEENENEDEREGVRDAGQRSASARADVGRRAGDRARRRDATENRRGDVRHTLRDELHVRLVPRSDHAIGDDGGEQRLDRREKRHSKRR